MEPALQSNSFLFALKGSDQDHTAVEAGLQVSVKARFVGKGQVFFCVFFLFFYSVPIRMVCHSNVML